MVRMDWNIILPILSGLWAIIGAVVTPLLYARKYRDPRRGMLLGLLAGAVSGPILLFVLWFVVPPHGTKCPNCSELIPANTLTCPHCDHSVVPHAKVTEDADQPLGALEIATDVPQPQLQPGPSFLREIVETLVLIAAIYAFVNLATARFVVDGHSMLPNFTDDQFIIVSRLSYIIGDPQRGDVVVFHYPQQQDRDFIKRVIGLPGETVTIQGSRVYINGKLIDEPYIDPENWCHGKSCDGSWEVGPDQYFVLGDNRGSSKDSQDFGPVDRKFIVGKAFIRYWPPSEWQLIPHHNYSANGAPLPTMTPTPAQSATPIPPVFSYPTYVPPTRTPTPNPSALAPLPTLTPEGTVQNQ